jgi:hypothetical protein
MSLENFTADASAERNEYRKLSLDELEKLDDAEAFFQRGDRILYRIRIERGYGFWYDWAQKLKPDEEMGWNFIAEAVRRGHPVALALCYFDLNDLQRAIELLRASADRGHVSGSRESAFDFQTSILTIFHSSMLVGRMLSRRKRS